MCVPNRPDPQRAIHRRAGRPGEGRPNHRRRGPHTRPLHPGEAAPFKEGREETLTVQRLGLTAALARTLRTTNIIESLMGSVESYTRRVKRWRGGQMIQRWVASALVDAEPRFRRVRGYRDLCYLVGALDALALPRRNGWLTWRENERPRHGNRESATREVKQRTGQSQMTCSRSLDLALDKAAFAEHLCREIVAGGLTVVDVIEKCLGEWLEDSVLRSRPMCFCKPSTT